MSVRIVIADDSSMSRKLTRRALPADWDATVVDAVDGEEALAACRAERPDLLLLDLNMPKMDGFDVLRALRAERLDCLTVVLSADIQPRTREQALALGAAAFIRKPVDAVEVRRVLEEHGVG
jgi:CheY-like chemotaxis protein